PNPAFKTEEAITGLGTGEALVSTLEGKAAPSMVERTLIRPPSSRIGPLSDSERRAVIDRSPIAGLYDRDIDRESAYEILTARAEKAAEAQAAQRQAEEQEADQESAAGRWTLPGFGDEPASGSRTASGKKKTATRTTRQRETVVEAAMKSAARSVA